MKKEKFTKVQEEILRLNKNIKDFSAARDILRAQVQTDCKHDTEYAYCVMDPRNAKGEAHIYFICCICGGQSLVTAKPEDFPRDKLVSFSDFNTIVRDLGLK
jgi:hypothetical protein